MNSEKVKEIKKALEQNDDNGIMYEVNDQKRTCNFIHHKDILTLISELESENERLSNTEIGELIKENEELEKQCEDWCELNFKKKKQVAELKDRIAELKKGNKENNSYAKGYADGIKNTYEVVVPEKLKQFAERLKDEIGDMKQFFRSCLDRDYCGLTEYQIDETLKEFINE